MSKRMFAFLAVLLLVIALLNRDMAAMMLIFVLLVTATERARRAS